MEVATPGFEPAPQLPPAKKVRFLTTGPCDHCSEWKVKFKIVLKYFSLPFTLFEPCGAVFMMNSKIHLRKNRSNEYFKAILHYFRVLFTLGLYNGRSINLWPLDERTHLLLRCSRWSSGRRSFGVKSSTARISSHFSNRALLCLQPAVIGLRNTLLFARRFVNVQ